MCLCSGSLTGRTEILKQVQCNTVQFLYCTVWSCHTSVHYSKVMCWASLLLSTMGLLPVLCLVPHVEVSLPHLLLFLLPLLQGARTSVLGLFCAVYFVMALVVKFRVAVAVREKVAGAGAGAGMGAGSANGGDEDLMGNGTRVCPTSRPSSPRTAPFRCHTPALLKGIERKKNITYAFMV